MPDYLRPAPTRDVQVEQLHLGLGLAVFADGTTGEIIMYFDANGDVSTTPIADARSVVVKDPISGFHAVDCTKFDPQPRQ